MLIDQPAKLTLTLEVCVMDAKKLTTKEIAVCAIVGLAAAGGLAAYELSTPPTFDSPSAASTPEIKTGSICKVFTFIAGGLVCSNTDIVESISSAQLKPHGPDVIAGHISRGDAMEIRNELVRVADLYPWAGTARVEVLSGPYQGYFGWVGHKWLVAK